VNQAERLTSCITTDDEAFELNTQLVGPDTNLVISDDTIKQMKQKGVLEFSDILRKPDKTVTNFERSLLRALHWFASAMKQHELENRILNLLTGIEVLLTPIDGNPIGTAVAEAVAILLSTGSENRIRLKRRIKQLYRLRSGISHGGHKEIFESDTTELLSVLGTLLMKLVKRRQEFESQRKLLDWIEEQKFN